MMQPNMLTRLAARRIPRASFRSPSTATRSASSFASATTSWSASAPSLDKDPGQLVSGLTQEQVDANPEIAEYMRVNFGTEQSDDTINGIHIPLEVQKEFGITEEDMQAAKKTETSKPIKQYGDPRVDAGLGTEEQQALNIRVLKTYLRQDEGTKPCNRLRNHHKLIPGILYGSDASANISSMQASSKTLLQTPWAELQRELDRFHRRFESRVYDLTVYENEDDTEGTVHRVLPRNVQRHPVQGKIYCSNFLRYHAKRPIKIPLQFINQEESPALKRDGYIIPVGKHAECLVEEGVRIPHHLEVECTGLVVKDVIRMDRVIFPDGVRPTNRVNTETFVVGPVRGGRGSDAGSGDNDGEGDDGEAEE